LLFFFTFFQRPPYRLIPLAFFKASEALFLKNRKKIHPNINPMTLSGQI